MAATINTDATIARARQLLHNAADASKQLEESVRELATMRAWEVLGYESFSEMWEKENGFRCPVHAQALALKVFLDEGMNTSRGSRPHDGHTMTAVARAVGLPVNSTARGFSASGVGSGMLLQLRCGVPPELVTKTAHAGRIRERITAHGEVTDAMRRKHPRRLGAGADELVNESMGLPRREADEIAEIARQADVPKAEIYRQAVAEYLMRHRESRPGVAS